MAHTLTPSDLLWPTGNLQASLFPDKAEGKNATDVLTLWLAQAQGEITSVPEASQNDAARHLVYARAYRTKADSIGLTPNKVSDSGNPMSTSTEWGADRKQYWADKAEAEQLAFGQLVPATAGTVPLFFFGVAKGQRGR